MQPNYIPDFAEFKRKCELGNVVPVYRQLMADTLTPVSAFQKIADGPYAFLLESAPPQRRASYIAFINMAALPATALPLVAGVLMDDGVLSMEALLGAAVVGGTVSALAALRLTDGAKAARRRIPVQPGQ